MKLFLIRHGETDWNTEKRLQGRTDIPMNETGIRQIEALSERLKRDRWDVVCTSPMIRARKTAEILQQALAVPKMIVIEDLQERDLGVLNGVVWKFDRECELPDDAEGMEVPALAVRRMDGVLELVRREYADKNVLLISHGSIMVCWYHAMVESGRLAPLPETYQFENGCVLPACYEKGRGWFWEESYL